MTGPHADTINAKLHEALAWYLEFGDSEALDAACWLHVQLKQMEDAEFTPYPILGARPTAKAAYFLSTLEGTGEADHA